MKFRQALRGDADEAKKRFKHLVSKTVSVVKIFIGSHLTGPRGLKIVTMESYVTSNHALIDTGTVLNLIPGDFSRRWQ